MKCYLSHSLDDDVRFKASSGGFCKEFIRFFIENKIVDKAIITVLGNDNESLIPKTIITNDIEKIISTKSNTIYGRTNPLGVLRSLNKDESYIFVGLPCHIKAVKKYCADKDIRVFTVSLFCNHTPDKDSYYKSILEKVNLTRADVKHFEYRGSGWPGSVRIVMNNNREIKLDHTVCWANYKRNYLKLMSKCKKCTDFIADNADVCVGDAWLNRIKNVDKKGTCIVLTMNPIADKCIKSCHIKGYISLEMLENSEFAAYHQTMTDYKIARMIA